MSYTPNFNDFPESLEDSIIANTLDDYYWLSHDDCINCKTDKDWFTLDSFCANFASAIISELGEESAVKIANVIAALTLN